MVRQDVNGKSPSKINVFLDYRSRILRTSFAKDLLRSSCIFAPNSCQELKLLLDLTFLDHRRENSSFVNSNEANFDSKRMETSPDE